MPDKPLWLPRIPDALQALEQDSTPWVERSTVEALLGVRRRRAQQILAELVAEPLGHTAIVEKTVLVKHLQRLAASEDAFYEQRRRQRLAEQLAQDRRRWLDSPPVLVELPTAMTHAVLKKDWAGLPPGVDLEAGRITVTFATAEEAVQKLVLLAQAAGRDWGGFEERVALPEPD